MIFCLYFDLEFCILKHQITQNLSFGVLKVKLLEELIGQAKNLDRILQGNVSCERTSYSGKKSPQCYLLVLPTILPPSLSF